MRKISRLADVRELEPGDKITQGGTTANTYEVLSVSIDDSFLSPSCEVEVRALETIPHSEGADTLDEGAELTYGIDDLQGMEVLC